MIRSIITTKCSRKKGQVSPVEPAAGDVGDEDAQRHGERGQRAQPPADLGVAALAYLQVHKALAI